VLFPHGLRQLLLKEARRVSADEAGRVNEGGAGAGAEGHESLASMCLGRVEALVNVCVTWIVFHLDKIGLLMWKTTRSDALLFLACPFHRPGASSARTSCSCRPRALRSCSVIAAGGLGP
jgi:hypothetical protein